jgi:hypothetical protein
MSFKFQDLNFNGQVGNTITDIPVNPWYGNGYVADVLVGIDHIYVLHANMNWVSQYNKNPDGTIGSRVRTNSWYNYDSTINQIHRQNSSVPSAYALFVENGQEYLAGWSMDNNSIYVWQINASNNSLSNRSSYNAGHPMSSYSRGGWDGDRYIYFMDQAERNLYRWDLTNKGAIPTNIRYFPNIYGMNSSFTGSGLLVQSDKVYWGTGSNQSDAFLGAWSLNDGSYLEEITGSTMTNDIGISTISGNNGNISISPLSPNIAFYFYTYTNQIKQISINSLLDIRNLTVNTPIHIQDAVLQADVTNLRPNEQPKFNYRILIQDGTNFKQVFPTSGWSISIQTPYSITNSIKHEHFKVGTNKVRLELKDELDGIIYRDIYVTKTNDLPNINAVFNKTIIHKDSVVIDASITDPEGDYVQYKVLVNGTQKYPTIGFTPLVESPNDDVRVVLGNELFNLGVNTVTFVLQDSIGNATKSVPFQVIKRNITPKVTAGEVKGGLLIATITDDDGDKVKYKVLLNDKQVFPLTGYVNFLNVPFDVKVRFNQDDIKLNDTNRAKIIFQDDMGVETSWEYTFQGDYSGLMFCDATESYYTNHIGEILQYLDFGTMVAGQTTIAERVFLKNTLGYPVENIAITVHQGDLEPPYSKVEISTLDSPFVSEPVLNFPNGLGDGQKLSFYVRIVTDRKAKYGGMFDITVKADPLKPVFNDKKDLISKITVSP